MNLAFSFTSVRIFFLFAEAIFTVALVAVVGAAASLGGESFFSADGDAALVLASPSGGGGSIPGGLNGNMGSLTSSSL